MKIQHGSQEWESGTLRFRGRELCAERNTNPFRIARAAFLPHQTAYRYMGERWLDVNNVSLDILYQILVDGLGYAHEDLAELPLGEVFAIIPPREL